MDEKLCPARFFFSAEACPICWPELIPGFQPVDEDAPDDWDDE